MSEEREYMKFLNLSNYGGNKESYGDKVRKEAAARNKEKGGLRSIVREDSMLGSILGLNGLAGSDEVKQRAAKANRPKASGKTVTIKGKTYDTGYHAAEIKALRDAQPRTFTPDAAADINNYSAQPNRKPTTEPEVITDSETRTNSQGVVQTGKNLGYISTFTDQGDGTPYLEGSKGLFDRLGLGPNVQINRNWSSNQLPGTESSPYQGGPVSQQLGEGEQNVVLSKDLQESGGAVMDLESMPKEAFEAYQKSEKSGDSESSGARDWMKPREMDANMARRAAFLDAPNSMAGMRAVDAQLGRVRAGGDYYYANPNAESEGSEFIKVSTETGRQHANGQITGQQLLNRHLERVKADQSVSTDNNMNPADYPADSEFSPDMELGEFIEYQDTGSQNGFHPDMEEEQFKAINY